MRVAAYNCKRSQMRAYILFTTGQALSKPKLYSLKFQFYLQYQFWAELFKAGLRSDPGLVRDLNSDLEA